MGWMPVPLPDPATLPSVLAAHKDQLSSVFFFFTLNQL